MTRFETELREALLDVAAEVPAHGVPPLRLSADRAGWGEPQEFAAEPIVRSRRWQARWLAPAAAGIAVLAIVAGVAAVADSTRTAPVAHHSSEHHHLGVPPFGGPIPTSCSPSNDRADGVPRYYIAETGTQAPFPDNPSVATVYATATGSPCARLMVPGGQTIVRVSAAADDHTFAVAMSAFPRPDNPAVSFYLVHFNQTPGIVFHKLPMPPVPTHATFDAIALSPKGDKLAVAFEPVGGNSGGNLAETFRVLNIATGTVRTWAGPSGAVDSDTANPWPLSWAGDDTTLAVNWIGVGAGSALAPTSGLRLLDTSKPGQQLVPNSRLAVPVHGGNGVHAISAGELSDIALLAPDGTTVIAAVTTPSGREGGFAVLSATTGHLERRLDWGPMGGGGNGAPMTVLWASPYGRTLIVYAPPGHPSRIGILRGNRLTLLPGDRSALFPDAAW